MDGSAKAAIKASRSSLVIDDNSTPTLHGGPLRLVFA
jgi:hypothetical protein